MNLISVPERGFVYTCMFVYVYSVGISLGGTLGLNPTGGSSGFCSVGVLCGVVLGPEPYCTVHQ